jgi:hypothetical protein
MGTTCRHRRESHGRARYRVLNNALPDGGRFFSRASLDQILTQIEALASRKSIAEAMMKTIRQKDADAAIQQNHEPATTQASVDDFSETN